MARLRFAATTFAVLLWFGSTPRADAGPIKHWGTFPGLDVRAVALRGAEMGSEPALGVIPGRDGYVYLFGKFGVYRVLDANGRYRKVLAPAICTNGGSADASTSVPSLVCERNGQLVHEYAGGRIERSPIPRPSWQDARDMYSMDYDVVTAIFPGSRGTAWFFYGYARGVGHRDAAGRTTLMRISGLSTVRQVAVLGDDVYLADEGCRVAHVRASGLVGIDDFHCNRVASMLTTRDRIWLSFGNDVVSIDREGRRRRLQLPIAPRLIAVDHHGSVYVLGTDERSHSAIATIDVRGRIDARTLPMRDYDSITVDQRDRLWIGVSFLRAFAVVAPKGAWG